MFKEPVEILPSVNYIACATLKVQGFYPPTFYPSTIIKSTSLGQNGFLYFSVIILLNAY